MVRYESFLPFMVLPRLRLVCKIMLGAIAAAVVDGT